jgi:hypothetical protein
MIGVIAKLTIKPGTNIDFEATTIRALRGRKFGDNLAGQPDFQVMQEV